MQIDLSKKVAVITGAASGIGLATVRQFLDSNAKAIVAVDIASKPEGQLKVWIDENPGRLLYVGGDVGLEATANAFTQTALSHFGRIDVLINNAATSVVKPLHEHSEEEWDKVIDINVKSMFWAAKIVIPVMMEQKDGLILNTGSISGHVGLRNQGAYGPSKGAVHLLTKQMAIEYAKYGIRVNAVALGTVDTPIVQWSANQTKDPEAFIEGLRSAHPIGRIATAEEAAAFFTYLSSDYARFFTGAILSMDGGFVAQ